jgi:hypothetical protein
VLVNLDLDRPRRGLIRIDQSSLLEAEIDSARATSGAATTDGP